MANKTLDTFSKMGGSTFASYRALVGVNEKAVQRLSQAQQDLISKSLETGLQQWTVTGSAQTLEDVLTSQAKVMQSQTEMLVSYAKTTAEILKETQEELQKWIKDTTQPAKS